MRKHGSHIIIQKICIYPELFNRKLGDRYETNNKYLCQSRRTRRKSGERTTEMAEMAEMRGQQSGDAGNPPSCSANNALVSIFRSHSSSANSVIGLTPLRHSCPQPSQWRLRTLTRGEFSVRGRMTPPNLTPQILRGGYGSAKNHYLKSKDASILDFL